MRLYRGKDILSSVVDQGSAGEDVDEIAVFSLDLRFLCDVVRDTYAEHR